MLSTAVWSDEMSTKFQTESNHSSISEVVTTSAMQPGPMMPGNLIPFKATLLATGVLGILTNGLVLGAFCLAGRSKMNASSAYIANHTILELFGSVTGVVGHAVGIAGVFKRYHDSSAAGLALCILFHAATLTRVGSDGAITSVVVHTLDRYWKIVHPIHHRKHYRRWMLHIGLFLPWLNGIAVDLLPAIGTSKLMNGICFSMVMPTEAMSKVCPSLF